MLLPLGGQTWRPTAGHSHAAERVCCYCSFQWSFSSFGRQTSEMLVCLQEHWCWGPCQTGVWTTTEGCDSFAGAGEALLAILLALHLPKLDLIALFDFEACCCTWLDHLIIVFGLISFPVCFLLPITNSLSSIAGAAQPFISSSIRYLTSCSASPGVPDASPSVSPFLLLLRQMPLWPLSIWGSPASHELFSVKFENLNRNILLIFNSVCDSC